MSQNNFKFDLIFDFLPRMIARTTQIRNFSFKEKINGATEKDIVHSGLGYTMKRSGTRIMESAEVSNIFYFI